VGVSRLVVATHLFVLAHFHIVPKSALILRRETSFAILIVQQLKRQKYALLPHCIPDSNVRASWKRAVEVCTRMLRRRTSSLSVSGRILFNWCRRKWYSGNLWWTQHGH